jgi:hypothetical protein
VNCKKNESSVFSRPEVKAAFRRHVLLRLYADTTPAGVDQDPPPAGAVELREKKFGTAALPLYAIVRPTGDGFEVVRKDEQGLIRDVDAFVKFLTGS